MKRKRFHRSWQVFLKYGPGLLIAGFIFWGFVILYKQDNWLGISALATLFLALGAFWAIWQNSNMQRRQRKERLLNEIIDWVEAITKFLSAQIVTDRANERIILTGAANRLKELNGLAVKGIYIESLAPLLFSNDTVLLKDIHNFRRRIGKHTRFLILVVKGNLNNLERVEKAEAIHLGRLLDDALNLIRLATRIYTEIK